jgi:alpha,alpha-trehalase
MGAKNTESMDPPAPSGLPRALDHLDEVCRRLRGRQLVVFLDYDGTLTPIVARPELATLSDGMRAAVAELASHCPVAIVSGRDRPEVERLVRLHNLVYAGSHGFDIAGPGGLSLEHEAGRACLADLDAAEARLERELDGVPGVQVERKRFAVAVHYRNVAGKNVAAVEKVVERTGKAHPKLARRGGKKVFELRPDTDWDKGKAVRWLLRAMNLDRADVLPVYLGDDETDEDAFLALTEGGLGIFVGDPPGATRAVYALRDPEEVRRFLGELSELSGAVTS